MTRFFSSWCRSLASLCGGTALAVTCFSAVHAGAMIVMSANSETRPASTMPAVTELLSSWDRDLMVYSDPNDQDAEHPALEALLPDEPQTLDGAASGDEVKPVASEKEVASSTETTDDDCDNAAKDIFSDYYKFRFGETDGHYGENAGASSPAKESGSDAALNGDSNDKNPNDECEESDYEDQPGDSTANGEMPADNEGSSTATPDADAGSSTVKTPEEAAKSEDAPKLAEPSTTDEAPKQEGNSSGATPKASKNEELPLSDSSSSLDIQTYYHYRYVEIAGPLGDNKNVNGENAATKDDVAGNSESGDDSTMDPDGCDDETAGDENVKENSSLADAMLAVASHWADDVISSYGLRISQVMGLLEQIR